MKKNILTWPSLWLQVFHKAKTHCSKKRHTHTRRHPNIHTYINNIQKFKRTDIHTYKDTGIQTNRQTMQKMTNIRTNIHT